MLAGVLVDVSGSMKQSLQLNVRPNDQHLTRAHTIFSTIVNIAKQEVGEQKGQEIFALAFGLKDVATCDLLALLDILGRSTSSTGLADLNRLLSQHGAPRAREYVSKFLRDKEAGILFDYYSKHIDQLKKLIKELPSACKSGISGGISHGAVQVAKTPICSFFLLGTVGSDVNEVEAEATRKYADIALNDALWRPLSQPKPRALTSVIPLLEDSSVISSSASAPQYSNLISTIEPYIYGETPMCEALKYALQTFRSSSCSRKALFLLSDGEATDGDPATLAKDLRERDVLIFACLLTSNDITHPRRLFYEPDATWTPAQRKMFEMSSTVENSHPALSILLEHQWELPASGHSRLFVQANHPDLIDEFSSVVRRLSESNDALLNIVGRVVLDSYINASISTFKPNLQLGGTCYANAVAAVFHMAMRRIEGREGGVPDFQTILSQLIKAYGKHGANTESVLKEQCPGNRLRYKQVDELGARKAINARRPVVATFRLDDEQWTAFGQFYERNPSGILEIGDLGKCTDRPKGHAVVLMEIDPDCLTFMNSWGPEFANKGFFKVRNQAVLDLIFYDVYWTLADLTEAEKLAFHSKTRNDVRDFLLKLPESVKKLPYKCPKCDRPSPACQFVGNLKEATCPQCHQKFEPTPVGLI